MSRNRWNILPPPPDRRLSGAVGLPPLISRILYHRGVSEPSEVEPFIAGDSRLSGDPMLLPGITEAAVRIYRALLSGEKIAVYGDYDADGVTATVLLIEGLSLLQGNALPYIPHRVSEGYGLKAGALESLSREGVSLVISVDCGVTASVPVKKARRFGLDIIVTDHHVPPAELPEAVAVIDPKLPGSCYPFSDLSGVGVAFKLVQALLSGVGREEQADGLLDLVALGTVADMVPLLGENRYLVKNGLRLLNESPRTGVRELIEQSGLNSSGKSIDAESVSWVLAPVLNAAGRLDHAMASYRLLATRSQDEAKTLTAWLRQKNEERQQLTARALEVAREQVVARGMQPLLFASDRGFPVGICGLVASRLADEFYRPAVVVKTGDRFSSGSCRSIPEFDIIDALTNYQTSGEGFVQFGGHSQAAGFTILTKNLPRLASYLTEAAGMRLAGVDLRPRIDIDAEVKLSDLGGDVLPMIQKLAPFGKGNPVPAFVSRRVEVIECRAMGNGGQHLRLRLRQGGTVWSAVAFGLGARQEEMRSPVDIVFNVEVDRWNGVERVRLNLLDFSGGNREAGLREAVTVPGTQL